MSQNVAASIKYPKDAFHVCPSCRTQEPLKQWSFNVYCAECGWDSSQSFIEAGGLDDLIYAYEASLEQKAKDASVRRLLRRGKATAKKSNQTNGHEVAHA